MFETVLAIHIVAGVIALGAAGLAVGSAKGRALHRRSGQAYGAAMGVVVVSTLMLVTLRPNAFLLAVGVFSAFLVFTGWRAAVLRDGRPRALDHAGGAAMALTGLAMLGFGAVGLVGQGGAQPVIVLVFGAIGLTLALGDWRDWRAGPITGPERIARHLSRMLGGTIAAITAAVTTNIDALPQLVLWLGPTVVLTPVIFWWTARVMRPRRDRTG